MDRNAYNMSRGIAAFAFIAAALLPGQAKALPVFAHRFGLTCQACHTTVPHLNAFGQAFARNGFRLPVPSHGEIPVAVKVNLAYSSDPDPSGLPKAIVDEVEVLTGGALGPRGNYFVEQYVVDGGAPGRMRDAWAQYALGETLHVRTGQFTLPLPVDPETQRDTEAHYLIYDQTVGENSFNFFDPRAGIDVYAAGSRDTAHFVLSGPDAMGYAEHTSGNLALYAYRYQGRRRFSTGQDSFFREGAGAQEQFGKFDVAAVVQQGNDSNGGDGSGSVASSGSFVEAHYAFSPALTAVARYDLAADALSGASHQMVLTFVTRPARNMRFTIEDQITGHQTLNLGWLFAY